MKRNAAIGLFFGLFILYLHQASPSVTSGDAGEFMATAATLSLAHPPSYPLYSLAARLFADLIPFGDFSYRTNVFSAFLSAATAALVFTALVEIGLPLIAGLLAALILSFGGSFWVGALVTEVFPLNAFFAASILLCIVRAVHDFRYLDLGFFLFGLGLANHQTLLIMGPVLVWTAVRLIEPSVLWHRVSWGAGLFLIGFAVNLYLPIRAAKEPPLNWGNPTSISRMARTLSRKDYGSFTLALGQTPARTFSNAKIQLQRFAHQFNREWPWPVSMLALGGLFFGAWRRHVWSEVSLAGFLLTGPGFFLLSNLPFSGQSEGVMGRFFILPGLFLVCGFAGYDRRWRWPLAAVLFFGLFGAAQRGWAEASAHRNERLVLDYGRSMLRSLPKGAALFMEGGDDAFYSLAYLHEAKGLRPDVELHDRGGLVYKNVYGQDFRQLTRDEKNQRRIQIERHYFSSRPLFYSTMDTEVLPGVPLRTVGFLMEAVSASGPRVSWDVLILRSLYPPSVKNYRTRALAAFFPFLRGRVAMDEGRSDQGLRLWSRAAEMGGDVEWLVINLGYEYAHRGFNFLQSGRVGEAEKIYRAWIAFDPRAYQAYSNLGVCLERQGRVKEALVENDRTADLFPTEADPLYNNAVVLWPTKDWTRIIGYLQRVLARNPGHQAASAALAKVPPEARR